MTLNALNYFVQYYFKQRKIDIFLFVPLLLLTSSLGQGILVHFAPFMMSREDQKLLANKVGSALTNMWF